MANDYKLIAESGKYDKNHKTWLDWHGANTTDPVGYMAFLVSRLIQQENIATDEARNQLNKAMLAQGGAQWLIVAGKGVQDADPNNELTAVTPAWRKTVAHYVGGGDGGFNHNNFNSTEWVESALAAGKPFTELREITPNSGAYWGEADRYEPNWEQAFWGIENYKKLKAIKEKYDPTGMFRVWNGVGGLRAETKATQDFIDSELHKLFLN